MTLYRFFRMVQGLLYVLEGAIVLYALMTWIRQPEKLFMWLEGIVSPLLAPFRFLNDLLFGRFNLPVDLTCVIAILCIQLTNTLWWRLYLLLRTIRGR